VTIAKMGVMEEKGNGRGVLKFSMCINNFQYHMGQLNPTEEWSDAGIRHGQI
jgi:hypothetical protein